MRALVTALIVTLLLLPAGSGAQGRLLDVLQMIRAGNQLTAAAFAQTSVDWLRRAQEGGADVAAPVALLEQVAAALSAAGV